MSKLSDMRKQFDERHAVALAEAKAAAATAKAEIKAIERKIAMLRWQADNPELRTGERYALLDEIKTLEGGDA